MDLKKNFDFEEGELLLIDKPLHWTSFDVVNKIRYLVSKKVGKRLKVGHAGTLDPLATGLLIICTGKKTKQIDNYQGMEKEYTGGITLGKTTPSYDAETEVNQLFETAHITKTLIDEKLKEFIGTIQQIPPMFSALKVNGKTLYEEARKGRTIEIQARTITIAKFEIVKMEMPVLNFEVHCSKGTYIRSLAFDLGKSLDSGAYLSELRRTKIGDYSVEDAYQLNDFIELLQNSL